MIPDIYDYLDYRHYLVEVYEALKAQGKVRSYRQFARLADSKSPDFLQRIRDRRRNITPAEAIYLCRALKIPRKKRLYFEALINFEQAESNNEKEWWFLKILHAREYKSIKKVDSAKYRYFSQWYVPVVRELMTHPDFDMTPAWIASRIKPRVSVAKVRSAIALIKSLELVQHTRETGRFEMVDRAVRTPSEIASVAVSKFHRDMISLGRQSLDRYDKSERDIRSITIGMSASHYDIFKQRMESIWKELLALGAQEETPEVVYQINLQLFPLSATERTQQ